jgi:sodium/glucose cotransporter 1/sodium/glucose cotransporter 9
VTKLQICNLLLIELIQGAFWGLMAGLVIGLFRFGLEFGYDIPGCGSNDPDPRPYWIQRAIGDIHYLHFGLLLFGIVCVVTAAVSLLNEPIPAVHVSTSILLAGYEIASSGLLIFRSCID